MHTVYIYVCLHLQIQQIRFFLGQHYKPLKNAAPLDLKTLCNIPVLPRNAPFNIVSDDRGTAMREQTTPGNMKLDVYIPQGSYSNQRL